MVDLYVQYYGTGRICQQTGCKITKICYNANLKDLLKNSFGRLILHLNFKVIRYTCCGNRRVSYK